MLATLRSEASTLEAATVGEKKEKKKEKKSGQDTRKEVFINHLSITVLPFLSSALSVI